jgi:alkylated DNA repair protein alkB family protein 6
MFHYYKYQADPQQSTSDAAEARGQSIDSVPVHSILLEPRSLIVTTGSLYTSHLHGIREIGIDAFTHENTVSTPLLSDLKTPIDNWQTVDHQHARDALLTGGVLERGTRYSLTCRDVGRVASVLRGSSR